LKSISFYRPVSKSFETGPSGKVSFYLSQGLPIITNKIPSVMDFISKYKCGICVDTPQDIGGAIKTILDNYSEYSGNTKICYENELEFSKHFKKVLDRAESLV
jgi:glycosyltransferase involved in cell wall biosynthesis